MAKGLASVYVRICARTQVPAKAKVRKSQSLTRGLPRLDLVRLALTMMYSQSYEPEGFVGRWLCLCESRVFRRKPNLRAIHLLTGADADQTS